MKKIIRGIAEWFNFIARFIDRKIITPITKFVVRWKDKLGLDGRKIERIINRKSSLLFVTLALALVIFFIVDAESTSLTETSAEVLYNQKVTVIYNEEAYVLEGMPKTVDITLIGRKADLYLAKQISDQEVAADLSGMTEGTHKVTLEYKSALESLHYKLDPTSVSVTIYPKVSEVKSVSYDVLNANTLDSKLIVDDVALARDEVVVKGAEKDLAKVAMVKALVDVNKLVDPAVGEQKLANVPLVAYDVNGKVVNVEIVPSTIDATVTITSPSKTVPLEFVPSGTLTFGKAISAIDSDINEVTIYGTEATLAKIEKIPVKIDVAGLKANKEYNLTVTKPVGVKTMSSSVANVTVTVGDEASKEFDNIQLEYRNLASGYSVNAKSAADITVSVVLKGVQSVLDTETSDMIKAYVDLSGYTAGQYDADVKVDQTDLRLSYLPKTTKVTLIIKKK